MIPHEQLPEKLVWRYIGSWNLGTYLQVPESQAHLYPEKPIYPTRKEEIQAFFLALGIILILVVIIGGMFWIGISLA